MYPPLYKSATHFWHFSTLYVVTITKKLLSN